MNKEASENKLFRREAIIMIAFPIVVFLIGLMMAIIIPMFYEAKADRCLDAGGSYNYQKCECDFKENHEFIENNQC